MSWFNSAGQQNVGQGRTKPTLRSTWQQSYLMCSPRTKQQKSEQPSSLTLKYQLLEKYYLTRKWNVVQRGEKGKTVTLMNSLVLELGELPIFTPLEIIMFSIVTTDPHSSLAMQSYSKTIKIITSKFFSSRCRTPTAWQYLRNECSNNEKCQCSRREEKEWDS